MPIAVSRLSSEYIAVLSTLALLLLFQFLGELLQRASGIPIPGPVLGMVGLLLFLIIRGRVEEQWATHSGHLLRHLGLFFIPAGAGLMLYTDVLARQGVAILASLVLGTMLAFMFTAKLMQVLVRRWGGDHP